MERIRARNLLDFSKLVSLAKKNYKDCRTYDGSNPAASVRVSSKYRIRYAGSATKKVGWGGRIRTYDGGIKNRCLTAWLRPNILIGILTTFWKFFLGRAF